MPELPDILKEAYPFEAGDTVRIDAEIVRLSSMEMGTPKYHVRIRSFDIIWEGDVFVPPGTEITQKAQKNHNPKTQKSCSF